MVEIDLPASDEEIAATIQWWLAHPYECEAKAAAGQRLALQLQPEGVVSAVQTGYHLVKSGNHGLYYPFPYARGCAAVNAPKREFENAWCTAPNATGVILQGK